MWHAACTTFGVCTSLGLGVQQLASAITYMERYFMSQHDACALILQTMLFNQDSSTYMLHMGDADPRLVHFQADEDYWEERVVDLALPPYWFFSSDDGIEILDNRLTVINSIGIHVPAEFSNASNIPGELAVHDLFTHPGEGRRFIGSQ